MRYNQEIIKAVINSMERFALILSQDGKLLAVNHYASDLIADTEQCIGLSVWDLNWWNDAAVSEQAWTNACHMAAQGERTKFIDAIRLTENKKSLINFSLAPVKDESGNIMFLLVEGSEIPTTLSANSNGKSPVSSTTFHSSFAALVDTEKTNKPVDALLLDSESRYRLMVESIEDYAMFMVDLDGFITTWNRGAERLTGYADIDAIGRHFSMLYPKDVLDKDHAIHELMMAQLHGRYEEEGIRVRKNGTQYHAQIIVWRIDNNEGNTVGYAKITRDVTALKEAQLREAQLFESENRFRLMVESINDYAMFMVDKKGLIISWNRGAERLTGYSESEALGQPFSILYPKNELSEEHALYELTSARTNGHHEEEGNRVRKDGSVYYAHIIVWPVADKTGDIVSFAKITRDITLRKNAERALKDSETKLHESARRKDNYLAMLAHELRNPLAPIRNSTELLRRLGSSDETLKRSLEVIDRQVAHMTRLIDDLLDVARISRGKIELRRENFDLGELISHTANDFKVDYENKKVALHIDVPDTPMWLYADRTRIAQAIGNLLHNALKFTGVKGEVFISLAETTQNEKPFAVVSVKDTGIGIDPLLLEQLFEPFVQGDQDLARSHGGLGLGLALIKGFARLHGGSISANSAGLGYGAEFIFQVPLSKGELPNYQPISIALPGSPLSVVLIDDNRDMVETLAALLLMDGHAIQCAYDGESGLRLIKSEQPDLVFCDIGLPGELDGYAVARGVRDDPAINKIFMVALSGYGQEKDKKLALECGFDNHLLKPVDFTGLLAMINAARDTVVKVK